MRRSLKIQRLTAYGTNTASPRVMPTTMKLPQLMSAFTDTTLTMSMPIAISSRSFASSVVRPARSSSTAITIATTTIA